ncbi:MAG: hypothetical protein R3B99_03480 [Polyangiales bacterium]
MSESTRNQEDEAAALRRLFGGGERHVSLFRYSITHSMAEFAIHDGFPFRRWPLYCRGVTRIDGCVSGGPYSLSIRRASDGWELAWGTGQLTIQCERFALGEFGTAKSPEFTAQDV